MELKTMSSIPRSALCAANYDGHYVNLSKSLTWNQEKHSASYQKRIAQRIRNSTPSTQESHSKHLLNLETSDNNWCRRRRWRPLDTFPSEMFCALVWDKIGINSCSNWTSITIPWKITSMGSKHGNRQTCTRPLASFLYQSQDTMLVGLELVCISVN